MKRVIRSMRNISVLLLMFYLGATTSCSTIPRQDSKLVPYVKRFGKDMNIDYDELKGHSIKFLNLNHLGESVAGVCYGLNDISIDPDFWYDSSRSDRERTAVMYHELVHCVCGFDHSKGKRIPTNCPVSIMNPTLPGGECLKDNWDYYIADLRSKCRN